MRYIVNNRITAYRIQPKDCPKCNSKAVEDDPKVLSLWRKQAQDNAEQFLISQFKKPIKALSTNDIARNFKSCLQYMTPQRAKLLKGVAGFKNRVILAARERSPGNFEPISYMDAIRIYNETRRSGNEDKVTNARYAKDPVLLQLLPPKFVADKLLQHTTKIGLNKLDQIAILPQYATLSECNEALKKFSSEYKLDADGNVILPIDTWNRIRNKAGHKTLDDWPIAMQKTYGKPGMLLPAKRGLKKKLKFVTHDDDDSDIKEISKPDQEIDLSVKSKPKPLIPAKHQIKPQADLPKQDYVSLDDWDKQEVIPKSKPVNDPTHIMNAREIVEFINRKANEVLLPGDMPRGIMTPVTKWSNLDWLTVHRYKQYVEPAWYKLHLDAINRSLRGFEHVTGETTASVGRGDYYDIMTQFVNIFDHARRC